LFRIRDFMLNGKIFKEAIFMKLGLNN